MTSIRFILTFLLLCISLATQADDTSIPPALNEWKDWVLRNETTHPCPRVAQQAISAKKTERLCTWPSQLSIKVTPLGGHFKQHWEVMADSWITLPGSNQYWPQSVTINKQAAVVLEHKGKPALHLSAGNYTVEGHWLWEKTPRYLDIPFTTGLITLSKQGKISNVNIDPQGRIWLQNRHVKAPQNSLENTLQVSVFRHLIDGIPLQLETELRLSIAGKPREITLGQLLPSNAESLNLTSPLPARIEADGRLKIQARSGQWVVKLRARYLDQPNQFSMKKMDRDWPAQEVWSFSAAPHLRGVKPLGLQDRKSTRLNSSH